MDGAHGDHASALSALANGSSSPLTVAEQRVFTSRCNRLLAEHLFIMGQYRSALALARRCPDADAIFIEIFQEALNIQEALAKGDTEPAHKWFQEAKFRLKHAEVIRYSTFCSPRL